jgi:bifunctional non-homologous end joining protein LigD
MDLETDFSSVRSKTKPNRNLRPDAVKFPKHLGDCPGAKKSKLPSFLQPQLATLVDAVPHGEGWLHEVKLDGYRALCRIDEGRVTFLTREAQDWTERFSALADAAQRLPVRQALLDGEVVALGEDGKSSFQLLQNSLRRGPAANLVYFAFDLLHLNGWDLTRSPLKLRKDLLEKILSRESAGEVAPALRYSGHWIGRGEALYRESCRMGLEGIVSKRADQPYRPGRGRDWLKVKCFKSQEFVIGGFTDPSGSRTGLGALLLGVYDKKNLIYAGKVGTGFTQQSLKDLRSRLEPLVRQSPPFVNPPRGTDLKGVHWVEPKLTGAVAFSEWTEDNLLRHPSFQGLREDKPPAEITRETASRVKTSTESSAETDVEIAGIKLTHPDKILYPGQNITKRELARYYETVANWMLPHLIGRPLTLVRCPEGRKKHCFYQRHVNESLHDPIRSITVREGRGMVSYVSLDSTAGLIALVQIGVLEMHTWGSRQERLEQPDRMIFDLDPDPALPWKLVKEAAQALRGRLRDLGLVPFVKTTGGKGLHVVVPIVPEQGWDHVKSFAKKIAEHMAAQAPQRYIATMSKAKRAGKIFIDYLRNARTATAVCAYSSRARAGAPVSVPLRWEELATDVRGDYFTIRNAPQRLRRLSRDPWNGYEEARAPLREALLAKL